MNRVQVLSTVKAKTIGLIIPSTTKGIKDPKLDDLLFFKILLPSFINCCSMTHYYNFFIGYDWDDQFFSESKNRDLFRSKFQSISPKVFSLEFVCFGQEIEKGDLSTMWSILADKAVETNEYLFQIGDDIQFKSKGWENLFISLLEKKQNIGAVGPRDEGNPHGILTQSFVHCTHLSIFKRFFPPDLKNWYIDDWISEIYDIRVDKRVIVKNMGGKERYQVINDKKTKDRLVAKDRELIRTLKRCKITRFRNDKNFIFLENNNLSICGKNFSSYDFDYQGALDFRTVKLINEKLNSSEIFFQVGKNLHHRNGNKIITVENNVPLFKNIENIRLEKCSDDIFLFQQFYIPEDSKRYNEVKNCLERNLKLDLFKNIYLINERGYSDKELGVKSDKIIQVIYGKRLTYDVFFEHAKRLNGFAVLSNSDIFFDYSLDNIRTSVVRKIRGIQCLRRYEYRGEENLQNCKLYKNYESSQDTWIIHTDKIEKVLQNYSIKLGVPGCDNRICSLLSRDGYTILNDHTNLKTYHNHSSSVRKYSRKHLPPPHGNVLNSSPLFNSQDLMDLSGLFWQYPVITEKTFFEQNKHNPNFLGVPWATVIDKNITPDLTYIQKNCYRDRYYTCCQHIRFKSLISLFKKLKIKILYTPHKQIGEDTIEGIQIRPCPLYAKIIEDDPEFFVSKHERKFLYSFQGGWQPGYMSDIRKRIFSMKHPSNCYIKSTGGWHFNRIVYDDKQNKNGDYNKDSSFEQRELDYKNLLKESRYTLCPSGTGPNSIRFWESLGAGSIPILLSDKMTLPFHPDWEIAIIRVSENKLDTIPDILSKIDVEKEKQMREKCVQMYNFFKSNYKGHWS